jgi:hypothetical protein
MWKKIIFGIVVASVLGTGTWYYLHLRKIKTPVSEAINAVPLNAALIFESRQALVTWKKLSDANIMWADLLGTEFIARLNREGRTVDSLLGLNPEAAELLNNRSLIISLHQASSRNFDFLYLYSLPDVTKESIVDNFVRETRKGVEAKQREYDGVMIYSLPADSFSAFSYAFHNGIFISSFNSMLVENSIRQLNSGVSLLEDKDFKSILNSAGEKVDGNIFISYKHLPQLLTRFLLPEHKPLAASMNNFAAWTGVDATIRPNEIMLSGFTAVKDSLQNYLGMFARQKPQDIEMPSVIPANTSSFVFFGISSLKTYRLDYKTYLGSKGKLFAYEQAVADINKKYRTDVEKHLLSWIGNEMAMVITEPTSTDFNEKCYAVIHSNDIEEAKLLVKALADSIAGTTKEKKPKKDTSNINGYEIGQLKLQGILSKMLGSPFERVQHNYFTAVGNYMVFANSTAALRHFINSYEGGKTLQKDQYYASFAENNLSSDANLYVYSNIARSPYLYSAYASEEHAKDIEKFLDIYRRFQALAVQFSANGKLFYSNVFIKHNPIYKQETNSLWELPLDTTVSQKPWLVINHNTKAKEIFVQDDANRIHLISNTGKVLWSRQLPEKIMSDVHQVDAKRNGKLQLLFNTRSTIYIIDRNGNDLSGYPVKLKSPATNGIAVFDYENNRDYRLLIACEDKRILNLRLDAKPVDGWKFDKTMYPVAIPVQHRNIAGNDNLFIIDSKGKVYVLDRHGNTRMKISEHLNKTVRSFSIEAGGDIGRTSIIACDTIGNVLKLELGGHLETQKLKTFNSTPASDYKDINNDKVPEYIFLDSKELSVYRQDKKLMFNFEFEEEVDRSDLLFFMFPDEKGRIGAVSPQANEVYLISPGGQMHPGFPVTGSTLFTIGALNADNSLYLVTASGKTIYVYTIE